MKPNSLFCLVVGILIIVLLLLPTGYERPELKESVLFEKAVVLDVDNSDMEIISVAIIGAQRLQLLVKTGRFKGDTLTAENVLLGQKKTDKIFEEGDKVLAVIQLDATKTHPVSVRAEEFYRQNIELILLICFGLFLVFFAKFTGFKALMSFVFTAVALWKLLLPLYLRGLSPIFVALGVVFLTSTVIILLVGGVNKKGFVALLGTFSGVLFTALLAMLFGHFFKIPGTVQEYSEGLLYAGFTYLDFSDIFISTIFLSAAGAVMDVSMDISASLHEIHLRRPDLSRKELIKSGFRIAAPVIGSMTTTLLFAYSGGFMFAFMAFMAKGVPFESILNTGYIAAEILHTLVGSFGLVLVAPLTAVIGGCLYTRNKPTKTDCTNINHD